MVLNDLNGPYTYLDENGTILYDGVHDIIYKFGSGHIVFDNTDYGFEIIDDTKLIYMCYYDSDNNKDQRTEINNITEIRAAFPIFQYNSPHKLYIFKRRGTSTLSYIYANDKNDIFIGECPFKNFGVSMTPPIRFLDGMPNHYIVLSAGSSGHESFNILNSKTGKFIFNDFHRRILYRKDTNDFEVVDEYKSWDGSYKLKTPKYYDIDGNEKSNKGEIAMDPNKNRPATLFGKKCFLEKIYSDTCWVYDSYNAESGFFDGLMFKFNALYQIYKDAAIVDKRYRDIMPSFGFHYYKDTVPLEGGDESVHDILVYEYCSKYYIIKKGQSEGTLIFDAYEGKYKDYRLAIVFRGPEHYYFLFEKTIGHDVVTKDYAFVSDEGKIETIGFDTRYKIDVLNSYNMCNDYVVARTSGSPYENIIFKFTGSSLEKVDPIGMPIVAIDDRYKNDNIAIIGKDEKVHIFSNESGKLVEKTNKSVDTRRLYETTGVYISRDNSGKCVVSDNYDDLMNGYVLELDGKPYYPSKAEIINRNFANFVMICGRYNKEEGKYKYTLFMSECMNDKKTDLVFFTFGEFDDIQPKKFTHLHFYNKKAFAENTFIVTDNGVETKYHTALKPDNSIKMIKIRK